MSRGPAYPAEDQTEDQIAEMFAQFRQTRDPAIRNRLVELNLSIADRCARRYLHRGEPLADLTQVARMSLIRAVDRFDPARGVRFEAFAIPTVLGGLRHHFRDNCWIVSVPRQAKDLRSQVFRASEQISQQLGRQPTTDEIADALGLPSDRVAATVESNRHYRATSWESLLERRDQAVSIRGTSRNSTANDDSAERLDLAHTIAALDSRLQQIVVWRFYEECTQREIGVRLGVGQVQVSRLLARALRQIRQQLDQVESESPEATAIPVPA